MFAKCLPVFVGALLLAGCGKKDDPQPPGQPFTPPQMPGMPGTPGTPPAPAVDLKSAKPDATYTRASFEEAKAKVQNFPMSKHGGKVIELKSVLQEYWGNFDKPRLALADKPNAASRDMEDYAIAGGMPVSSAFPTQTVTLRAFVDPDPNSLAPYAWHLVGVEGPPPLTITAETFVKERAADDLKFEEKYKFKYIFVTGTVAKFEHDKAKISTLELEGSAGLGTLVCLIDGFFRDVTPKQLAALKPGAKVKVLGAVLAVGLGKGQIVDPAP